MKDIPRYGDVLGYVVWFIDPVGKFQRFGMPTTSLDRAIEERCFYSENGATCFIGEIHMVTTKQAESSQSKYQHLRAVLERLLAWDMLTLNPDGSGAVTTDAPWIRSLIVEALDEK